MTEFEDIEITGVNNSLTHNPEPSKLLYDVYLQLSHYPPPEWSIILEQEHRFPRSSMWRRVRVEGDYLVVHCPLEEVKDHLEYLKQDVSTSNEKYRQWIAKEQTQQQIHEKRRVDEEKRKNDMLDSLDFD